MPPPARAPADPHPASADADSAELIPGHIPFPPPDLTEASDGVDARAPPRLYPALPRGLKPFEPPTREERRLCRVQNAVREFCRATSRDRGGEDDARERRVREGDVKRWGDDAGDAADGGGGEDDATRDDGETSDSSEGATERWIERFRKSRAWETCRVTDESIVPREILECAFPETRAREDEDEDEDEGRRGKKRAASRSNGVTARSSKRGRATASGSERLEDGGTKTKMKDGFSRLERLVQLESRAEAEGAGRGGRDDDEEGYDDGRGQTRSGRASGRRSTRDRSRSLSRNPRRGGANDDGGDDDDKFGDDDDELESDDDYGQGANFDDDEGYDDDVGDGNAEAYF